MAMVVATPAGSLSQRSRGVVQTDHTSRVGEPEPNPRGFANLNRVITERGVNGAGDLGTGALDNQHLRTVQAPRIARSDIGADQNRDTSQGDPITDVVQQTLILGGPGSLEVGI